jgi:sensor histidine kinase YesM
MKKISPYWWCQLIGWSANIALSIFFVSNFGKPDNLYYASLFITCLLGLFITHVMRHCIFYLRVMEKPVKKQILSFILLTFAFSIVLGVISESIDYLIGYNPERLQKYTRAERLFLSSFNSLWLILIWNLIYYLYHYVESNRRQQLDTLRLEAIVKSLELQTIKSHINPHFIFNSLNSIRALVDENPARARTAITELSNILRSSLQVEKMETVPLKQELDIVRDYLALEHIRFEERLKVDFNIHEETLNQPIPPMMLQTLVENAIKHGISKQINGGYVNISSAYFNGHFELTVKNSGILTNSHTQNSDGFGIKSTKDRLGLLFQNNAQFNITSIEGENMVECKITMPVVNIL